MITGKNQLFRRVAIIGVGLIGGSISLAMKKHRLVREIVGISRRHSSLMYAFKNKIIDRYATNVQKAVQNCDLVIMAVPVKTMIDLLPAIGKHVKRGTIITDVGSTKATIVEAAHKYLPQHSFFVGSHPIAGSEKKGAMFANAQLFENSLCVMTPTDKTNRNAKDRVKNLWNKLGAEVKFLPPDEHDKILSYVSHVPHVLAYGLIEAVPPEYLEYVSGGLRDMTRIASSDPYVWSEICMENSKNIAQSLDKFIKVLSSYRKSIVSKDQKNLTEDFKNSKNKRDGISRS